MELTGEPISAQRALAANMVSKVVPHGELMAAAEDMARRILRNDPPRGRIGQRDDLRGYRPYARRAAQGRMPLRLRCAAAIRSSLQRSQEFFDKKDKGRAGANATAL